MKQLHDKIADETARRQENIEQQQSPFQKDQSLHAANSPIKHCIQFTQSVQLQFPSIKTFLHLLLPQESGFV